MTKDEDDAAATLAPVPEDLDDFGELLDVARARVDAFRAADGSKPIGDTEPVFRFRGATGIRHEMRALKLDIARLVVGVVAIGLLMTRHWIAGGVALAVEGVVLLWHRWYRKTRVEPFRAFRRRLVVRPVEVVSGSEALFQGPLERLDDPMVVFVWTEDPVLERDPAALHRLGGRVYGAAHADEVPDDWADVRRHIRRLYLMDTSYEVDHARAVPLPRSATGNDRTFFCLGRWPPGDLPNRYIDRRVFLALVPDDEPFRARVLAPQFWWNRRAHELTSPSNYLTAEEYAAWYGGA